MSDGKRVILAPFEMPEQRLRLAVDPADATRVRTMLATWRRMIFDLSDPHVELTIEEIAPILSLYSALRSAGVQFDEMLTVLLSKLRDQAFGTEDDSDTDPGENHAAVGGELPAVKGVRLGEFNCGKMAAALAEAAVELLPGDGPTRDFLRDPHTA